MVTIHSSLRGSRKKGASPANPDDVRWDTENADGRYLQQMIECGAANGMTAGDIRRKYPHIFGKYSNQRFTGALRRARISAGVIQVPSPAGSRDREVRFEGAVGRKSSDRGGMSDMMERLRIGEDQGREEEDDDDSFVTATGMVAGDSCSREIVSSPSSVVNWYLMACWTDQLLRRRISFDLLLPALPEQSVRIFVESGGWALIFQARLPDILVDVDKRNASFFDRHKADDEEPLYGPSHCRTIAQKEATRSVLKNQERKDDPVFLTQSIRLPFQCEQTFLSSDEQVGLKFYATRDGTKMAVVELVKKEEERNNNNNNNNNINAPAARVEVDLVSFAGVRPTATPLNFSGRSVVSYGPTAGINATLRVPTMVMTNDNKNNTCNNNNNNLINDEISMTNVSWFEETVTPTNAVTTDVVDQQRPVEIEELSYQTASRLRPRKKTRNVNSHATVG